MDSSPSFSERHGYSNSSKPIKIRYEAPEEMRLGILNVARKAGFDPDSMRTVICFVLDELPLTSQNWSAQNIMRECEVLIASCEWFEVYDICEAFAQEAARKNNGKNFEEQLNKFFQKKGVGWKIEYGLLSVRGEEDYEVVITQAKTALEEADRKTAAEELKEALQDLSRRPEADITGAIQHSMAALECLAKDISGDSNKTLGALIEQLQLPSPVDEAVKKMWGFASNQGRHIAEGRRPNFSEAMLTVHFCSALISYLSQRN